jgi:hypothetical protein
MEQIQKTLPVYICGVGRDERSSIGKTQKSYGIIYEEIEEQDATTNATETKTDTDAQPTTGADTAQDKVEEGGNYCSDENAVIEDV